MKEIERLALEGIRQVVEGKVRFLKTLCSVFALTTLFAFPVVAAPPPAHSMNVCDFVKQINDLDGRIVSVRGTLLLSETEPEGAIPDYLVATCSDPKQRTVKVKVEYPDVGFLRKPPKGFRMDKRSFLQAHTVIMGTLKDGMVSDRYVATIAGQAYSPPQQTAPPPGLHVTREGSYDAGLVIEGIYDVKIPVE